MKIRIISYEDVNKWVLGKFTTKLREELHKLSIVCDISNKPDNAADINHHLIYTNYDGKKNNIDTLMITHVDTIQKIKQLKKQLEIAEMGICMSRDTQLQLIRAGLNKDKICYVNPAHDGIIKPRPKVIGICTRVYKDGRKREFFLEKISEIISPNDFSFKIMGSGWQKYVELLKSKGFQIDYDSDFKYEKYIRLIPSLDYYLYLGLDEGQLGFIDALAAGVETIVPPIGYHLDIRDGITYQFTTLDELIDVFEHLIKKRKRLIDAISIWTWKDYTKKHLEIWKYLLEGKDTEHIINSRYDSDGLRSLSRTDNFKLEKKVKKVEYTRLRKSPVSQKNSIKHFIYSITPFWLVKLYNDMRRRGKKDV